MGMTIDEAIKLAECGKLMLINPSDNKPVSDLYYSLETLINISKKYQKIEQILKDIPYGGDATVRKIQEVIEDGMTFNNLCNSNS